MLDEHEPLTRMPGPQGSRALQQQTDVALVWTLRQAYDNAPTGSNAEDPGSSRPVLLVSACLLGVECNHCHVGSEFDKEDKPAKQTARKMLLMVRAINKDHFDDRGPVTCWMCHRGSAKPESLPK